jgi:3-phenylpropionate/trans-cinnamate dioxygenase ferredoxin reductase subunit
MADEMTVIIGGGQAGAHAAVAAREAGLRGRLVILGAEPHVPYERPPLSKAVLTEEAEPEPGWFHKPDRYDALGIGLRLGAVAEEIDVGTGRVRLANGESLAFDRLLLATGGRVRRLDIPGAERILYLRTLDDARRLRAALVPGTRVACIGAGVIGLEVAASARQRGCEVTVIEAAPAPLGRCMTPEMAEWVAELHRREGVAFIFGATIEAIEPGAVRCDGGRVAAEVVIAGIGILRNTELAARAGIATENGVVVDELGRSSAPGVFAAGDVAAFWHPRMGRRLRLESWRHAQDHGIAVGRAMAGAGEPYSEVPWFWTDQFGRNIQVAGLPAEAVRTVWRGTREAPSFCAFHLDAAGRVVAATGVNAAREVRVAMMLIAAGATPDATALADPARKLQTLVPR